LRRMQPDGARPFAETVEQDQLATRSLGRAVAKLSWLLVITRQLIVS
jgi:hypothetical protein